MNSRLRAVGYRLAAVTLVFVPLLMAEGVCRLAGWGLPERYDDPFVGFSATRPLFVPTQDGTRYETAANRLSFFQRDSFAMPKPAGEFRVFCLGASTVQGRPYSIPTSFTSWLELSLRAADPSRSWRVVNCGGISYASYRLVPILEEVLQYDADLIIFYEGDNEFLEDRTYRSIKHAPPWFTKAHEQASRWRIYNLVRGALRGPIETDDRPQTVLGPETDARLDWSGGLAEYHRDLEWQQDCISHFEFNLRRAVAIAKSKGVPFLLVNPASSLDWPPFKAEYADNLSEQQRTEVDRLWNEARDQYRIDQREALRLLQEAAAIDNQHAGLQFDLGKCLLNLGHVEAAREALVRAKDQDICPLRILSSMNEIVIRVARETGVMFVDADALFSAQSPGGINGTKWFVDHTHPTIAGQQLLANAFADELVRHGVVRAGPDWPKKRQQLYQEHIKNLPANYFPDGQRRLRGEQRWAHGQSTRERETTP